MVRRKELKRRRKSVRASGGRAREGSKPCKKKGEGLDEASVAALLTHDLLSSPLDTLPHTPALGL